MTEIENALSLGLEDLHNAVIELGRAERHLVSLERRLPPELADYPEEAKAKYEEILRQAAQARQDAHNHAQALPGAFSQLVQIRNSIRYGWLKPGGKS